MGKTKSLTDVAKAVLMKESNDSAPDRDAQKKTANAATLRPKSKVSEPPKKIEGEVQDLGDAITSPTDPAKGPFKADDTLTKDTSKAAKSAVGPEPRKSLAEDEQVDEEFEISEELEAFIAEKLEEGLSEEEIAEAIEENFEVVTEEDESETVSEEVEDETVAENTAPVIEIPTIDMTEHVDALFEGEDLSEEFKEKAKTIFEAAVNQKVELIHEQMEAAYTNALQEQIEQVQAELTEAADGYLNYVAEQWMQDNEVAIESGLRTELTEEFITGLRQLFVENYIDIPEDKIDVIEELTTKLQETETKLNEQIEINVAQKKAINEAKAFEILVDAADGLTDIQAEKLRSLAENIEFTNETEYADKINTLKESYFPVKVVNENATEKVETAAGDGKTLTENVTLTPEMERYVRTLGKVAPRV